MDKIHHIIFSQDIDGVVSAAIFLHNCVKGDKYRLYPVQSSRLDDIYKVINKLDLNNQLNNLVMLNVSGHIKSSLWIDRHFSKSFGNGVVKNSKIIYDPRAKCTASLVKEAFPFEEEPEEGESCDGFIKVVETISQGTFRSLYQIFHDTHPIMILRAYMERSLPTDMMFCRVVEMISSTNFDFRRAVFQLGLGKKVVASLMTSIKATKKKMTVLGNFSIISLARLNVLPKYSEFFVKKDLKYAVRVVDSNINNTAYVQIGHNKWSDEPNEVDLGKMLHELKYVRGKRGHYNLSGGTILKADIERLLDDISLQLNKEKIVQEKEEMEKLGVDTQNDPVEAKAQEMVKTGEMEDIVDAREEAASEETEGTTVKEEGA